MLNSIGSSNSDLIVIRAASQNDAEIVVTIKSTTWVIRYDGIKVRPDSRESVTRADIISINGSENLGVITAEIVGRNDIKYWVAEYGGIVVGYCKVQKIPKYSEIKSLYILSEYQRLGIGRMLMVRALDYLGDKDCVYVDIIATNDSARSFYAKFGFTEYNRRFSKRFLDKANKKVEISQLRRELGK